MKMFNDLMQLSFNKEAIWNGYSAEGFGTFVTLQQYVYGAQNQWKRVQENKFALESDRAIDAPNILRSLFLDIHFYFICAGRVQELIERLADLDGDEILIDLGNSNKKLLMPYTAARSHLDDIERRLTGRYMSDFIKVRGDTFSFGGENFDLGESSLKLLTDIYDEVVRVLLMRVR